MKKRISSLLLAVCLLLTTPALAAGSTGNLKRSRTYAEQFSDLEAGSVFYVNVAALYEYGLSQGKTDGTFGLSDPLTVGQAVIFAGRIRSLYCTGDPEHGPAAYDGPGLPAAWKYLRYLQEEGILGAELEAVLDKPATRAQMAHTLANILPEEALPAAYDGLVTEGREAGFIPDVTEQTLYWQDILALYRKGVCVGVNAKGAFLPDAPITRGAAAAMLTRMVDASLRTVPQWDLIQSFRATGATLASLVPSGVYYSSPTNTAELEETLRYMLASGSDRLSLRLPGLSAAKARQVMEQALVIVKSYCEQSYNSVNCSFTSLGDVTLTFSSTCAGAELPTYRNAAMEAAITVHDQLWAEGQIHEQMTEYEKARVYYTWICDHCVYDYGAGKESLSHIPYSLFHSGVAVCDGYTGAYNLLLKLEGIDCTALSNKSHIWTVATLDGTEYHIDTTWGDSGKTISYAFFAMTEAQSWAYHSW